MRHLFLIIILSMSIQANAQIDTIRLIRQDVERIESDIKEIRRDQLNYKIEKDLLKETYSSNYSMIQIFISLILGVFAILGYLGLKSIMGLKKEYDTELGKLKDLKGNFESQLKSLSDSQNKVEEQIKTIDSLNEIQNSKIKILELREKVNSLYSQSNYQMALDYLNAGLSLAKDDLQLLIQKGKTLNKLGLFSQAVEVYKQILLIEPQSEGTILDLAELFLIVNLVSDYEKLIKDKSEIVEKRQDFLKAYFEAFKLYRLNDLAALKNHLNTYLSDKDLTVIKKHDSWGFSEFYEQMNREDSSDVQKLLIKFVNYLDGTVAGSEVKKIS